MNTPRDPIRPKAMLWLALLLCHLSALAQEAFSFHASGLSKWGLADDQGKILQAPIYEELRRLPSGNWRGINRDRQKVDILDARGALLASHGHCDIGEYDTWGGGALPSNLLTLELWPEGDEPHGKSGLLDSAGRALFPPRAKGRWGVLPHPERVLWVAPPRREIVEIKGGHTVLRLEEDERLESGPFPKRLVFWIQRSGAVPSGRAQDESGRVLFSGEWKNLRPMAHEGWLADGGRGLGVLNPDGTPREDAVYLPAYPCSPREDPWPLTVKRIPRSVLETYLRAQEEGKEPEDPNGPFGWLFEDGRFQPLDGYQSAQPVVPGRWVAPHQDGSTHWLDALGHTLARWKHASISEIPGQPGRLWLRPDAKHPGPDVVMDLDGNILFKAPGREELKPFGMGYGTYAKNRRTPLWITPGFKIVPLDPRMSIAAASPDGSTLVLQGKNRAQLFDPSHRRSVGQPFHWLGATVGPWVIFNREGYMGLMDWAGREVLPAAHYEIKIWRPDRIWASRQTGDSRTELSLLDASGKILCRWEDGYLIAQDDQGDLRKASGVLEVVSKQQSEKGDSHLIQEWVNLAGEVVLRSNSCQENEAPHPVTLWSRSSQETLYLTRGF